MPNMPFNRDRSFIGVNKNTEYDRDVRLVNHMGRIPRDLERDDSSLESIGQFGFTDPFSAHAGNLALVDDRSIKCKRVTWKKNVKMGNNHVGCLPAFRGCSPLPDKSCTAVNVTTKAQNFLQRFAEMALSNVQKCGIGSQCGGEGGLNAKALRSILGGEMCMAADGYDVANNKCAQCQSYFHERAVHDDQNFIIDQHQNHNAETALLRETRDAIEQSRDAIIATHSAILETRMDMLRSEKELRERRRFQNALDAHRDDDWYNKWEEEVVHSPKSILKKVSFGEDFDDNNCNFTNIRSPQNSRLGQAERKPNHRKKRILGRFAVKLAKPMDIVKHGIAKPIYIAKDGIKRNGPKRVLAITSRRY
jgi:hypothetical protein